MKDKRITVLQQFFQQQPAIRLAILFGSCASNSVRFESDIDLAVELDHVLGAAEKSSLIEGVAAISGRAVDLIDLKVVGQPLLGQIVKHGIRLVGDDVRYGMLLSRSAFDYADFLPYRQRILDIRRQSWIGC